MDWSKVSISPNPTIRSDRGGALSSSRCLYVECTYTFFAGGNTGIRRVARNLANYATEASDIESQLIPVVWGGIGFFTPSKQLRKEPHFLQKVRKGIDYLGYLVGEMFQAMPLQVRRPFTWSKRLFMKMIRPRGGSELVFLLLGVISFPFKFLFGSSVRFVKGTLWCWWTRPGTRAGC